MSGRLAMLDRIEETCRAFEAAWAAGGDPRIDAFLGGLRGDARAVGFRLLLEIDRRERTRSGRSLGDDEYRSRYAEFAAELEASASDSSGIVVDSLRRMLGRGPGRSSAREDRAPAPAAAGGSAAPPDDLAALLARLRERGRPRYAVGERLAQGGMGAILRAHDQDLQRDVAMKVALPLTSLDSGSLSIGRFLEEALFTGRLEHPGIVPVHDLGVDANGDLFFTMKLVEGEDLRAVYRRVAEGDPEWTRTRALGVLQRVCETVAFAHAKGVLHRDLKPGNVMVGEFGEAYVMDWGLARAVDRPNVAAEPRVSSVRRAAAEDDPGSSMVTVDGAVVGTPAYMPPEQASGSLDELGPAADVYAVGAMLYHLLAGHMPYVRPDDSLTPLELLARVRSGPPAPLAREAPDTPAELVAICERAMARRIEDRYADMTALGADLRAFLEQRVVAAHATGPWVELKKWVERNRATAAVAVVALVATIGLAVWAHVERDRARTHEAIAASAAVRADVNERLAIERAADAEQQRDSVRRLSDALRLAELRERSRALWPAEPDRVEDMSRWLADARALVARRPEHERTLGELRSHGRPLGPEPEDPESERVRDHDFGDDIERAWWHDALRDLVVGLHAFEAGDRFDDSLAGMEARLVEASTIAPRTTTGPEAVRAWEEAREAIRAHPEYGGLDLPPQLGLFPLGPDPETTLWEFWHVPTGDRPERDPSTGRWAIEEATGIVFVLIPGGTFWMGAQASDPDGPNFDRAARDDEADASGRPIEVTLAPYFLSKYELTQGQWLNTTGTRPSRHGAPGGGVDLRHPVERRSWWDYAGWLPRYGLRFPTEAQWEYAARAGTDTPWWTGGDLAGLDAAGNVADRFFRENGGSTSWEWEPDLDDGYMAHAPVGTFAPNGFGLHDVIGNLMELCLEVYALEAYAGRWGEGDGELDVAGANLCTGRGGAWSNVTVMARSAARVAVTRDMRTFDTGLRPARAIAEE